MFPIYPGFEELPIRVEVEWHECKRLIVARLERWLESKPAALVCTFEDDDDEGEWIVTDKYKGFPYTMGRPDKLLVKQRSFDEATRVLSEDQNWKEEGQEKLIDIVQRAFSQQDFTVARLLELPELPPHRNLALCFSVENQWIHGFKQNMWAPFSAPSLFTDKYTRAQEQLREHWSNPDSEIRFAYDWAALDDEQRKHRIGLPVSFREMERIMDLVLTSATKLWQEPDDYYWTLYINGETGIWSSELWCSDDGKENHLSHWDELLVDHFLPQWNTELLRCHPCVSHYMNAKSHGAGSVQILETPTAHEQLEAKLQLREWLQDKATPAQIAELLDI